MNIEPKLFETFAEIFQATFSLIDCLYPPLGMTISASKRVFKGRKPWIKLNNT